MLRGRLRDEQNAQHVHVELLVEVLFGDLFDRRELVDARVVHDDIEPAIRFHRRIHDAFRIRRARYIARDRDGLAIRRGDVGDDRIGARPAACIVDDH